MNNTITDGIYRFGKGIYDHELSAVSVLILTFLANLLIVNAFRQRKTKRYANGPWGLPIIGHLPFFGQSPPETFAKWRAQYGDVFRIRLGSWNAVIVNGYNAVKEASEKDDDFSGRPAFVTQDVLKSVNGDVSLAFGPFNDTYLYHRKLTAIALRMFTNRGDNLTEELIIEESNRLVDTLLQKAGESTERNVKPDIQFAVGSIIYQILYGRGKQLDIENDLKRMVEGTNEFTKFTGNGNPFDVMPWLQYVMPGRVKEFKSILSEGVGMRLQQVQEHLETYSESNIRDVADALIAADIGENDATGPRITRSRILTTLADLQGAGFDTTNKSLQWLTLYMASYPEVQERVHDEIDDVIGSEKHIRYSDHNKLVYTEATYYEVMRKAAIAPFGLPKCATTDTTLDGFNVDKNTVVFFNLHSISHDKVFWGDPEEFRPERLITKDNTLDTAKCGHILPFGLGRRKCVGEFLAKKEIFILFATLMQRCKIVNPEGETYDLQAVPGLVYSPKDFKVLVQER
ncbi:cytochrome P450 1A1-like [Mya arenaria]|uniref:cytochrome P450 1A1-like n=1 Tax=Mya arenaria TaxID=6604 RepID=UPI0022E8951E|nr:cytochrome P450 1A1-like [Mya arenaria]